MAEITSNMVKQLREKTFAGMMDCKKALTETGGDMAAACDWLREKGILKAAKKSDRVAANGLVAVAAKDGFGIVVEVNSETDFVAANDKFQKLVADAAAAALAAGGDLEKTREAVGAELTNLVATIGENMTVRRTGSVRADVVSTYIHNAAAPNMGKIGVIVGLSGGDKAAMAEIGAKIAMHVAASKPDFAKADDVLKEVVEKEKKFFIDSGATAGKPDHIAQKMVEGRIQKYFSEIVLEEQEFVMEPGKKVKAVVAERGAVLVGFEYFLLGDGIETVQEDFAAEVSKMVK
ncbi:MAG: translation elongation factor Ts [Rickettsiales bacterium]|jgi:elongation factor Ts|nr:translation elongation factor Ts [Rickettsiales bacterium]